MLATNDIPHPQDIVTRFLNEQEYIQRFIFFLEAKSAISESVVTDISSRLHRHGLPEISIDRRGTKWREPLSLEQIEQLLEQIRELTPALDAAISEADSHFNSLTEPDGFKDIDSRSEMGEWIEYFVDALDGDRSQEMIDTARREATEQIIRIRPEMASDAEPPTRRDIDFAIASALYILSARRVSDLAFIQHTFQELELASRIAQPQTQINILRQGFLLLMTTFDAAIFDLVRVALKQDFFGLIGTFAKQDKLALDSLSAYKNFESFRDDIIETQLKSRYLKDLLLLLHKLGAPLADPSSTGSFAQLVELVLRRNIHVHNRGVVDDRYLERDDNGKSRFNIYSLEVGSLARIDDSYWQRANSLCRFCVDSLAKWTATKMSSENN